MADALRLVCAAAMAAPALLIGPTALAAVAGSRSIGTATQEADGTIVLMLRAEAGDRALGDAQFRYAPGDKDYRLIARHVGSIPLGKSVAVAPFPER